LGVVDELVTAAGAWLWHDGWCWLAAGWGGPVIVANVVGAVGGEPRNHWGVGMFRKFTAVAASVAAGMALVAPASATTDE
jgi:hypothetical protein